MTDQNFEPLARSMARAMTDPDYEGHADCPPEYMSRGLCTNPTHHETHVCRDCGAAITLPYAPPPLRGWDIPIDGDGLSRWADVVPGEEGQNASSSKKPK